MPSVTYNDDAQRHQPPPMIADADSTPSTIGSKSRQFAARVGGRLEARVRLCFTDQRLLFQRGVNLIQVFSPMQGAHDPALIVGVDFVE